MPAFDPRLAARRNQARKKAVNGTRPPSPDAVVKAQQNATDEADVSAGIARAGGASARTSR